MQLTPVAQAIKIHAKRSPSSSGRWTICHASYERENAAGRQDRTAGRATHEGTIMHDLGEHALKQDDAYVEQRRGVRAMVDDDGTVLYAPKDSPLLPKADIAVDDTIADGALAYADFVRNLVMGGGRLLVEQRLSIAHITGEAGAKGTSDTVILFPDEICIVDLKGGYDRVFASYPFEGDLFKYGPKEIQMRALFNPQMAPNTQLVMYAEAALNEYPGDYKRVRIIIYQPRLEHVDEYVLDIEDFRIWVQWIREQSLACEEPNPRVVPGEKQCKWCSVFPCQEATNLAVQTAVDDFEDKPRALATRDLGRLKKLVPIIRMFCDSVEARVYGELTAGNPVDGWKLIKGQDGDREWRDESEAWIQLRMLGLDVTDITKTKLVGPASIEKMVVRSRRSANRKLTMDQWELLQNLISRSPGGPMVVPATDPREALASDHTDGFDFEDDSPTPGNNAGFFD